MTFKVYIVESIYWRSWVGLGSTTSSERNIVSLWYVMLR